MARRLGKDTIVITEPGTRNDHGKAVDDWAHPASTITVERCYVELDLTEEDLLYRDAALAAGTVYAPTGTALTKRAKVTYAGQDYAVDGKALEQHSYSGRLDYVPIPIKWWEG